MLHIYNTLTKQKEIFKPLVPKKVKMYVCGMTVYDYCHIGHARVWAVFDMIIRYLRLQGYDVECVRNITDIDDKIIKRAHENNEEYFTLTDRFIHALHEDEQALNVLPPSVEPRATQYIDHMITLISRLIEKGSAYQAEDGDVYFSVAAFPNYGNLSHQDLEKLRSGARVAIVDVKRDPLDFVLWKMAKPNEPAWDSPWGNGRPGWHIECSAMSMDCLGEHFDIHGGGFDLTFPHHENEVAQSESATGKKFVNYWMHVGYLQMGFEKMSKSLGNIVSIRDALSQYPAEVLRYFLVASHYRSPVNYTPEAMESAYGALERFYLALRGLPLAEPLDDNHYTERFQQTMNDDFNTPETLAVLFDLVREINRVRLEDENKAARLAALLRKLAESFGILTHNAETFLRVGLSQGDTQQIEALITARDQARKENNWKEADRLRAQLTEMGITLEDTSQGTVWRK